MNLKNIELLSTPQEDNIVCKKHSFIKKNVHWHTYYELELVVRGEGTHIINGTSYPFKEGDVFLLMPSDFHEFKLEEEGTTYLIEIPPSLLPNEILDLIIQPNGHLIKNLDSDKFNTLKNIFLTIENHYQKNNYIDSLITKSLLISLLSLFISYTPSGANANLKSSNARLREILLYIQQTYQENITLENISALFFINKEYLSHLFKSEIGIPLTAYIRKLRLSHAAKLVITTRMKSIDISEMCGFNSIATFMRNFKNEYGVSPMEMRQNYSQSAIHTN